MNIKEKFYVHLYKCNNMLTDEKIQICLSVWGGPESLGVY
jgi:hypothetical protein